MNASMNSNMWRTTHRFGALLFGLILLFACWEMAHDEESSMIYRVGGAGVVGLFGLLALLKGIRPGGQEEEPTSAAGARRLRKERS